VATQQPPYWTLISVLFSSFPLEPALAMTLHQAACELYRQDGSVQDVAGDMISGKVRNLRKQALLGAISGPAFEAEVDTARGSGQVRFLLTRDGLELSGLGRDDGTPRPNMRPALA
jgi:hypothetical protein